jgi:hypothetical protein
MHAFDGIKITAEWRGVIYEKDSSQLITRELPPIFNGLRSTDSCLVFGELDRTETFENEQIIINWGKDEKADTIIFSNNNHHLLRHLDHSIKIKTTKKTINLAYDIEAATLHEEKYELKRTGRKTYSGTVKIEADIERYEVKIEDPTSDEKEIKRTEPYKMTVVYNISESDLIELFKGIKSIKIKNAKVNNSLVSDGRSDVTYTYNNNEISDYLHRSYLLIQEKLNKK